ncbi:MAG: AMP-binding protein [Chitinophagaceae bacterium]
MKNYIDIEYKNLAEQSMFQLDLLKQLLHYCGQHSLYYQNLFKKNKIQIEHLKTLDDFSHIPTTNKEDIQLQNEAFFCIPKHEIAEYTTTSGTLGKPIIVPLSKKDIERLKINEKLSFELMGITTQDVVQLMLTIDKQFMAGLAYYLGAQAIGAATIRSGIGAISYQWQMAQTLQTTAIVAVPSFIYKLLKFAIEEQIDFTKIPITKALCIGEGVRLSDFSLNKLGEAIHSKWNIQLYNTYASTEMQTAFTECEHGQGGHHHPALIYFEVLDEQNKLCQEGEYGEIVISTLGVSAMPLIRYRTGDIACYYTEPCSCGRKTKRLSPIQGRKNHMIKYKGTTLFPNAIFEVLNEQSHIQDYAIELLHDEHENDLIKIYITTSTSHTKEVLEKLPNILKSKLRVTPIIIDCPLSEINQIQNPEGARKVQKLIDHRVHKNSN